MKRNPPVKTASPKAGRYRLERWYTAGTIPVHDIFPRMVYNGSGINIRKRGLNPHE